MTLSGPSPRVGGSPTDAAPRVRRYAFMSLAREFDSRFELLLRGGRISKWYSAIGNEAITVTAGSMLEPGDVLCSLHRDLGAILAYYLDPARTFPELGAEEADGRRPEPEALLERLARQVLGRQGGFSEGVERSYHYGYFAPEAGLLHVGMISHLGAMIPVASGCAFALRRRNSDRVAINFIGEGGTSTGDFHEALNQSAIWKLPLVLVVENNRYAFSTPSRSQYACLQLSDRGPGYGIASETVDGNDPDAMARALERALARARTGQGPTLLEAMVGRLRGHAEGDGSMNVVPAPELELYRSQDPVPSFGRRLEVEGVLTPERREAIDRRARELVERAVEAGLAAPLPASGTALRPVFAERPSPPVLEGDVDDGDATEVAHRVVAPPADETAAAPSAMAAFTGSPSTPLEAGEATYLDALHDALEEEMERDPAVVLLGQDIGAFEGAFRVTRGLHARWPERVLDTPISESGTLGLAAGAALLDVVPVVEMQFADFVSCGFNQIANVIAKLFYRFERACPLVVRLPAGGGVGAGPFHSQNPEAWFAHVAGLKVVCPATAADAKGLLKASIRDPNPVLFFENKYLYRRIKEVLPEGDHLVPLGRARLAREGGDLTIVGWGASTWTALEAADELAADGVEAEVVDLRTLVPLDRETVVASAKKTGRVLVVHEAQTTGGFGGEVAAVVADEAFAWLDAPVRRLGYPDRPSPYARVLEQELLPDRARLVAAARDLLAY